MEFLAEIKGLDLVSEFFIKSSVILTFTFVLVFLFRKKSASLRHFLLSVSLLSLLLFPFFSTLSRGWRTGLLPTWQTGEASSQISQQSEQDRQKTIPLNSITSSSADQQLQALELETNGRFNFFLSKYSISKEYVGLGLAAIWSAGLILLLSRICIGLFGAYKLTRQGKEISDSPWRQLLNHFLESISIKRRISLLSHKNVNIPLTLGVIKPVVILPTESKNWTQDQRSSALFHELSHIKRCDFLVKILARCSVALYWFNPLSWFAFKMMKKEQEKACDELVLKAGVKPSTYAVNLLSIKKAGQFPWNPPTAALGAVGKSQLNERLIAILKQQLKPKEVNMKTKMLLSSLIIMSIAFIGMARPSQSEAFTDTVLPQDEAVTADTMDVSQETTVQEKQVKKTTKKTEKKEAEEKTDKKLTWVSEDGKKIEIIISTDEEGEIKLSKIGGDMVIQLDKDSDENTFTLSLDDKILTLHKDEHGNWSLHADKKEALSLHISTSEKKNKYYNVVYQIKGDKDGKNYFVVSTPKIHIEKHEKPYEIVNIHVSPKNLKLSPKYNIHVEGEEGEKKAIKIAPHVDVHAEPNISTYSIHRSDLDQKELKEKLAEITERLKNIRENELELTKEKQEEALKEVEEMLKKLSEELKENKVELKDIALSLHADIEDLHLDKTEDVVLDIKIIEDFNWVEKKDVDMDIAVDFMEGENIAFISTDDGGFQISMKSDFDSESKSKYEEIVKKLKKDLPKGYTVESIIDEEAGTFTINIKGIKDDQNTEKKIKEILADLKAQLSKIK